VQNLSGGELQRVAIVLALAKPCDIYLIDEPSAYLDSEQRVIASRVMKRWIMSAKRAAFVVEHDFIMATYLADKVILFDGEPAKETYCTSPETMVSGMNKFLKLMDITFRRDPTNFRPRINKMDSQKDQEQKKVGNYFLIEETLEQQKERIAKMTKDLEETTKFQAELEKQKQENPDQFKKTGAEKGHKSKKVLDAQRALAKKREMEKKQNDDWQDEEVDEKVGEEEDKQV